MTVLRSWKFALLINVVTILVAIGTTRSCTIDCAYCKHPIFALSPVENVIDPWAGICKLHLPCAKHLSEHVLPKEGLTIGEWLSQRGYDPGSVNNNVRPIQLENYPSPPLKRNEFTP